MCIAMIFSVLPVGVLADVEESGEGGTESGACVVWIGETGYTTLEAAINEAEDGATIKLGEGRFTTYGKSSPKKSLTFEGAGTGKTLWGLALQFPIRRNLEQSIMTITALTVVILLIQEYDASVQQC